MDCDADLGSRLGLLGLRLSLLLLALQSGHVVVVLAIIVLLLLLATNAAGAAELGEVDAAEVAVCTRAYILFVSYQSSSSGSFNTRICDTGSKS